VTFHSVPIDRLRVRASASAVLWLTLSMTMAILAAALLAGGSAKVLVVWLFDRKVSLANGEANVVKLTLYMAGCALGSVAACFITALLIWSLPRFRAWLSGYPSRTLRILHLRCTYGKTSSKQEIASH
jgi:hypothetical protein